MVSSITAPAGACQVTAHSALAGATAVAAPSGLPGQRVLSERTVAGYAGMPSMIGVPMAATAAGPNGVVPAAAMPMAAMSGGPSLYRPPHVGAANPAPYEIPPIGCLLPMQNAFMPPPPPPRSLAAAMPDPLSIENQKSAYTQRLDDELRHSSEMLKLHQRQHADYIHQAAEAQKRQMICQIEQHAKEQELQLSQQMYDRQRCLQQEYQKQKFALEKRANDLSMEYQRRKAQDELMARQYEMQLAHQEEEMRLAEQCPSTVALSGMWPYPACDKIAGRAAPDPLTAFATSFASTTDLAAFSPTDLALRSPSSASTSSWGTPCATCDVTSPICVAARIRVPAY